MRRGVHQECSCQKHRLYLAENLRVAENHHAILGTRQRNVQPARIVQESNALVLVAPNAAQDDVVLLSALEGVDAGNFDLFVKVLLERAVELHIVDDVRPLSLVWCDHSDLAGNDTGLEELGNDLLDIRRLGPVDRRQTRHGDT